jgi:hypothetical protein
MTGFQPIDIQYLITRYRGIGAASVAAVLAAVSVRLVTGCGGKPTPLEVTLLALATTTATHE